jgi:phospholipase A1/A2
LADGPVAIGRRRDIRAGIVLRFLAGLLLIGLACLARAEWLIVPDQTSVFAGSRIELTLILSNDNAQTSTATPPAQITFTPRGKAPQTLVLHPLNAPTAIEVAPGAVVRIRYAGELPADLVGEVLLETSDFPTYPLFLSIAATPPPAVPVETPPRPDIDAERFAAAYSPYEPNYISAGSVGPSNARFQVSLKFRVFNPNTRTPMLEKLYLSYSQTSIWDLSSKSKPFRDSSYRPSVFFLDEEIQQWPWRGSRLGLQGGFEHESNGKDGANSRSLNILFVKPTLTFPLRGDYFISLAPKFFAYQNKDENPDIPDYRGYADLQVKWGETDGFQMAALFRQGNTAARHSVLMDLSYPLKRPTFGNLGGYLHVQIFDGYGESLIEYNQKSRTQFRIGLMITR